MPFGPGTYGNGGGAGLAGPAIAQQGIPEMVMSQGPAGMEALSEIVQMLKNGQIGAEKILELFSLLAQSTLPQMDQRPQQPAPSGPGDIAGLLGG